MDLKVQTYRGKPVLTWWEGQVIKGYGEGKAVIADTSYRTIATVNAGNGLPGGPARVRHQPAGHRADHRLPAGDTDLSALGGPAKGVALSGVVQEIDIATGKVLFEWGSLDHVPVTDTTRRSPAGTKAAPFDYLHINSIAIAPDGDLMLSARNTSAIYKVARPSGKVAWRLGGKRSSFAMGPGATFWFQHHITPLDANTVSIFDDGGAPPQKEAQSRAILLDLDTAR